MTTDIIKLLDRQYYVDHGFPRFRLRVRDNINALVKSLIKDLQNDPLCGYDDGRNAALVNFPIDQIAIVRLGHNVFTVRDDFYHVVAVDINVSYKVHGSRCVYNTILRVSVDSDLFDRVIVVVDTLS